MNIRDAIENLGVEWADRESVRNWDWQRVEELWLDGVKEGRRRERENGRDRTTDAGNVSNAGPSITQPAMRERGERG